MGGPAEAALVGAGYIANVHADALRLLPDARVAAVVDRDERRAVALAARLGQPKTFKDVSALISEKPCRRAHVLVPPDLHRPVAEPLLEAGFDVLLEKPMAASAAECAALNQAAAHSGARLAINQNMLFLPAYCELKALVTSGRLGALNHLVAVFSMPLRQLAAGQFHHWMFRRPVNILLEQAVHPLSQLVDLMGSPDEAQAFAAPPRHLAPDLDFYPIWQISLRTGATSAQLSFSVGASYPTWRLIALCQDGIVFADMLHDRITVEEASRWPDFADAWLNSVRAGARLIGRSSVNGLNFAASILRLKPRSDPYFRSMLGAVHAFHSGAPMPDGRFGATLVQICERLAESAGVAAPAPAPARPVARTETWDVAVLGGTGFIGRHLVERLLAQGKRVGVLARGGGEVAPAPLDDPRVALIRGDVARKDDVLRAIGDAKLVVNLAQGAEGRSEAEIERAMADSARLVGEACLEKGVEGLVHVSSIAALWLGEPGATVTGATPPDPERNRRAVYSRGKAAGEEAVLALRRARGLPVCVLRPGVVVGRGGGPFHSGLGFFNRERHCMGWDRGDHPLPFVLAEDVADAIVLALADPARVAGRTYNLVGDVRLSAREYIAALGRALGRPLVYHGQSTLKLYAVELGKWLIKRAAGRKDAPPSLRDLRSRGMPAHFDCADAKRDLGWRPVADREEFLRRAIEVHGQA